VEDDEEQSDAIPTLVICSGEFVEQVNTFISSFPTILTVLRLHIRTIPTRLYSYFRKLSLRLSNTSLLPPDLSIFTPSPPIALLTMSLVLLSHSYMPFACLVTKPSSPLPLPSFVLL
jgi:hypothetical protein